MDPGRMTERLLIMVPTKSIKPLHGTAKEDWKPSREIWCEIKFLSAFEQQQATGQTEVKLCRIATTWFGNDWIKSDMGGRWTNGQNLLLAFTGIQPNPAEDELIIQASVVN